MVIILSFQRQNDLSASLARLCRHSNRSLIGDLMDVLQNPTYIDFIPAEASGRLMAVAARVP